MKNTFPLLLLLISLNLQGQNLQRIKDSLLLFSPTGKGLVTGEAVSQLMNKEGGTLISPDKMVAVVIPPGALSSEIKISITPITNLATTGIGNGYRFEPSGLQFLKPAELIFQYTGKDTAEGSPQLISVSTQDKKGSWLRLNQTKRDFEKQTITGIIHHFSDYIMSWDLVMFVHKNMIKVSKEVGVALYLTPVNKPLDDASIMQFIAGHKQYFGDNLENPRNWSVNDIPHGGAEYGEIIEPPGDFNVIYRSPVKVPDWNPVKISVQVKGVEVEGRFIDVHRTSYVRVYDALYQIDMTATMNIGDKGNWGGTKTYKDEGLIIVSLDAKVPFLAEVKNKLETMTDNCQKVVLNPQTCTGIIHFSGLNKIILHPPQAPGQPDALVEIFFLQRPAEFTRVKYNCPQPPGFKGNRAIGTLPVIPIPALPLYLKFAAKEGEQVLMEVGKPGSEMYYKISVRQLTEEDS